jgi:hypothetical protein
MNGLERNRVFTCALLLYAVSFPPSGEPITTGR